MSTNAENPTDATGEGTGTGESTGTGQSTGTGESATEATAPTTPIPPAPPFIAAAAAPAPLAPSRPHIRWGGVVWGLILVAIAGFVLFTVSSNARQSAFDSWVAGLTPGAAWTLAVVAVGVFILILALLAVVRSAQRNRRA